MKKIINLCALALLAILSMSFSACDYDDVDRATVLNGTWHGSLGQYYSTVYGDGYDEWETEFRFATYDDYSMRGEGVEVDYDPDMWSDFKYYDFNWEVVNGSIYLYYRNGDRLMIRDYQLSDYRLSGILETMDGYEVARLDLGRTSYWPWGNSYAKNTRAGIDAHAGIKRNFKK